jgi:hypothetical protein
LYGVITATVAPERACRKTARTVAATTFVVKEKCQSFVMCMSKQSE